uniref:Uncharacterized protein n=1 Tax=Rhizophora mucronata TaxID=61149 RepID=A0A2P2QLT1_RHIMU
MLENLKNGKLMFCPSQPMMLERTRRKENHTRGLVIMLTCLIGMHKGIQQPAHMVKPECYS